MDCLRIIDVKKPMRFYDRTISADLNLNTQIILGEIHPSGIEPEPAAPETAVLSIILWVLIILRIPIITTKSRLRNITKTLTLQLINQEI